VLADAVEDTVGNVVLLGLEVAAGGDRVVLADAVEDAVDSVAPLELEVVTRGDRVAFFWDTRDEVVDEREVTDDLVTMEDVVDATDCDTTEDVVMEDDAFRVALDFVATETGVSVGFVAIGVTGFGWGATMGFGIGLDIESLGVATHDEMSDEIKSVIVSTTSVDENKR
jgi:hypothetical protein